MPKGQPSGTRVNWDEAKDKRLLFAVLMEAPPSGVNWGKVAERTGLGVTPDACRSVSQGSSRLPCAKKF
jgi:hypothetical protein